MEAYKEVESHYDLIEDTGTLFKEDRVKVKDDAGLEHLTDEDFKPLLVLYLRVKPEYSKAKQNDLINAATKSLSFLQKTYNILIFTVQDMDSKVEVFGQNSAQLQLSLNQSGILDLEDLLSKE